MTRFLFTPASIINLALLVMNVAVLGYLVSIRGKSRATWWLVAVYAGFAAFALNATVSSTVLSGEAALWRVHGILFFTSTGVALWALMGFAYRFAGTPFPREMRWATWATGAALALDLANAVRLMLAAVPTGRGPDAVHAPLMLAFMAWTAVVLVRKRRWARRAGRPRAGRAFQAYAGVVGLLVAFLAVQALANVGVLAVDGPARALSIVALLGFFFGLAAVYLTHAPEPTTLQAKLVGLALVAMLSMASAVVVVMYPNSVVADAAPQLPQNEALRFTPDGGGGYTLDAIPVTPIVPGGDRLGLRANTDTTVALGFPFPFYGEPRTEATVDDDPIVTFGRPLGLFENLMRFEPAAIVPLAVDLNFERGAVYLDRTPRRVTLTWFRTALAYDPGEATVQLVLHADGRIDFRYGAVDRSTTPLARGLIPGPGTTAFDRTAPLSADLPARVPAGTGIVEHYDLAFRQATHERVRPLVWLTLVAALFVVVAFPLFFRGSLLRPLRDLLDGVRRVDAGDLSVAVPVGTPDEFGRLSAGFNGMTASLRDHTERLEDLVAERTAELEAAQARLVHAEKMASLGSLTAGIAHEIKNPLNFVTNFASLSRELADELAAETDPEERDALLADLKENAAKIEAHGRRADAIVRSMMDHARSGPGERRAVDLNRLVEEYAGLALHAFEARQPDADVALDLDLADDAGTVDVVAEEVGRVVVNLVDNALGAVFAMAASTNGACAPTVTASTRRVADGVEVRIADNGPGMPAEVRERVFEPFFTTKPTGEGTGLGLSLAHDIVTQGHGGTLSVESAEGKGTTFLVVLPVAFDVGGDLA